MIGKTYFLGMLVFCGVLFTGCGQTVQPPLYSWGNYVKSSANYGMNGTDKEVLEKHLEELKQIIDQSQVESKRVAPGIYAEYAQILFDMSQKEKAKKYFLLEKQTYPEATVFIDRVTTKLYGEVL